MHHKSILTKSKLSRFVLLQKSIRNPYFQLAWEEGIALSMEEFGMDLGVRIWRNQRTLVLGISEKESQTIHPEVLADFRKFYDEIRSGARCNPRPQSPPRATALSPSEIPPQKRQPEVWIARRASGGGTVFQDVPGNLNFSLFVDISKRSELYPIQNSYDCLLGIVRSALARQNCHCETAGKSDISIHSSDGSLKKISGNAQFRKKKIIVQHGTLILDPELFRAVELYQLHPPEEPDYRRKRSHADFLTHVPSPISEEQFAWDLLGGLTSNHACVGGGQGDGVSTGFPAHSSIRPFLSASLRKARALEVSKYSTTDWIFRSG